GRTQKRLSPPPKGPNPSAVCNSVRDEVVTPWVAAPELRRTVCRADRHERTETMSEHEIVSHDAWLRARKEFLTKEKEFTHARDALSEARRALPWEKV